MKITKRAFLALLLVLIVTACFVTGISGPTAVSTGDTVTYDIAFETDSSGANGTAYVFFDVPAGWTFNNATYDANVNGANVSGSPTTGVSSSGSPCVVLPLEAGYQRLGFSQTFPTVTASDSGVLHVTLTVGGAAGGYTLEATGAGTFGGPQQQCNATRTLDITVSDEPPPLTPPSVSKSFSPASIVAGGTSRLTITLSNANAEAITGVAFTDTYPAGLTTDTPDNITTTCGGTASSTASSVSLTGGTIPANGSCTVAIDVTAAADGSYVNSIPAGAVTSSNAGSNTAASNTATLSVGAAPPASAAVPTASEWALMLMAAALVVVAMKMMR
jgi:large repetitive protein